MPYTNKVQSTISVLPTQAKVANLIFNDPIEWNMQMLKNIFSTKEASVIFEIPLSRVDREDKQVRNFSKNGLHFVKSAYHLHRNIRMREACSFSRWDELKVVWQSICKLKTPSGTKMLI